MTKQIGADEIEITTAMIEAGSAVLDHQLWLTDPDSSPMNKYYRQIIVKDVFQAMISVSSEVSR